MMLKSKLVVGKKYFSLETRNAGNTTMKTVSVYETEITSIEGEKVYGSWNGNPVRLLSDATVSKLKEKRPVIVNVGSVIWRKASKDEIAELKATGNIKGVRYAS